VFFDDRGLEKVKLFQVSSFAVSSSPPQADRFRVSSFRSIVYITQHFV